MSFLPHFKMQEKTEYKNMQNPNAKNMQATSEGQINAEKNAKVAAEVQIVCSLIFNLWLAKILIL